LKAAVEHFSINLENLIVLDIGASTGGFSDYCLRQGCAKLYAVDVGSKQLAGELLNDPQIIVKEKTDIRTISKGDIEAVDFICCDVSFISLSLLLPKLRELSSDDCAIICLFKPQFEVGPQLVGKKGIVKNLKAVKNRLNLFVREAESHGLYLQGLLKSPILGKSGNQEYLLYFQKTVARNYNYSLAIDSL